jgi:predicted hotdog family 3-hydroxylacyl-ACP dehydratase
MRLDKTQIAERIPHAGAMCLLDEVLQWDEARLRAVTRSHLDAQNPLRHDGRLSAMCVVEYASQAMAVHGSLAAMGGKRPRAGYLVSARNVDLHERFLDRLQGALVIDAERLAGDADGVLYRFDMLHEERPVASGVLMVILDAGSAA